MAKCCLTTMELRNTVTLNLEPYALKTRIKIFIFKKGLFLLALFAIIVNQLLANSISQRVCTFLASINMLFDQNAGVSVAISYRTQPAAHMSAFLL